MERAKSPVVADISFQNNVPDSLLSGKELPTFKFELEKSKGRVLGNSFGKEATVEQLPISKGIAGVSMQLEPGVMRTSLARDCNGMGVRSQRPCSHNSH